ncbi:HD domain-containing phosphohydrolase, partial [Planctomycetota bacterium]
QEDMGKLTEYITGVCKEVFEVIHVTVFYFNEKWNELSGKRPGDDESIHFPKGEGLAGVVADEGECLLLEGVSESPVFKESIDGIENYSPNDILSAPMVTAGEELTGIIQLVDKKHGNFTPEDEDLLFMFCSQVADAVIKCRQTEELMEFSKSILENISYSIDAKYAVTVAHTWRVRDMAVALAQAMELSDTFIHNVEYASLFHTVGRLAYNTEITELDPGVETGRNQLFTEAVIRDIQFPSNLHKVKEIVLHTNERPDGTGTPDGLSGNDIPLGSRIIAVCSAYDTLFFQGNEQVKQYNKDDVISYIQKNKGILFDEDMVDAFIEHKIYEKEKRRHKRIEYTGEVDVTLLNDDGTEGKTFTTKLLDLSSGGVLFFSEEDLGLTMMVKLRIALVTGGMSAIVRTARVMDNKEGGFNIGAYFIWSSSRHI